MYVFLIQTYIKGKTQNRVPKSKKSKNHLGNEMAGLHIVWIIKVQGLSRQILLVA